jgi:hypothetical protein
MSLDRLINLAKRTGDRLIIHDPVQGRDLVILDIDAYEKLVLGEVPGIEPEESDWHSAGSILNTRYSAWDEHRADEAETLPEESGKSLVDALWEAEKAKQEEPKVVPASEDGKKAEDASDEPVFYEEPVL